MTPCLYVTWTYTPSNCSVLYLRPSILPVVCISRRIANSPNPACRWNDTAQQIE